MATNIVTAEVSIVGTRPFLFHKFGPEALPLEKQERSGVAGNNPDEWRKTFWYTKDGQLYMPPSYIFGSCINGAVYTKRGRGSIQKSVAATLQVTDSKILFDRWFPGWPQNGGVFDSKTATPPDEDDDLPVYLDIRATVNPSTKGRNIKYRIGLLPKWNASFTLQWDKTIVSRGEMEAVLRDAGKLVGVGSGRKIGMGRFDIANISFSDSG